MLYYFKFFCLLPLIILFLFHSVHCAPVENSNRAQIQSGITPPEILEFMRKFGYLDSSSSTSEALYHEDAVIAAIKNVQKYGALNETGVLDNATLRLMTTPRCGVADIPRNEISRSRHKRFVIGSRGWRKRRITYFIANWSPKVGEEKVASGMRYAFDLWSKYSSLRFVRAYDPDADIIIAFGAGHHGDRFPFDGPGNVLAHAFYPYEMSDFGGDIHFDNDENWRENAEQLSEGVDFQSVATHELGHSLGLAHSPIFSSIMFPYYKGPQESKDLNYDDIMAMYELYIKTVLEEDDTNSNDNVTNKPEIFDESDEDDDYFSSTTARDAAVTRRILRNPVVTTRYRTEDEFETTTPLSGRRTTFHGDFESVDGHKRRFGFTVNDELPTSTAASPALVPNLCDGIGFDAVGLLRGEIFIFKEEFVWRLTDKYRVMAGYPVKFRDIFPQLPEHVKYIDAIYERATDDSIVLFHGTEYWVYDGDNFIDDTPRPITDFGFDSNVTKVDAAMVWSKNHQTYLFAGKQFLRYNEQSRRMDDNYPANISEKWRGIPNNIDAATSVANGKTYFFKGNLYWLYNNSRIRPERGYPRRASTIWLGCPLQLHQSRQRSRQQQH